MRWSHNKGFTAFLNKFLALGLTKDTSDSYCPIFIVKILFCYNNTLIQGYEKVICWIEYGHENIKIPVMDGDK